MFHKIESKINTPAHADEITSYYLDRDSEMIVLMMILGNPIIFGLTHGREWGRNLLQSNWTIDCVCVCVFGLCLWRFIRVSEEQIFIWPIGLKKSRRGQSLKWKHNYSNRLPILAATRQLKFLVELSGPK